jgi:hypothetical protein
MLLLHDIVITRDSLIGLSRNDSAVVLPIVRVRSVEVRRLDTKKVLRNTVVAVGAYLIFRIVLTVFYATAST